MPNVGDVLKVQACQKLFGQDVCMVFTVRIGALPGVVTLDELIAAWRDFVGPAINAIQSSDVQNVAVKADNLSDGIEFAQVPWTGVGSDTGSALPSYVALGVQLTRGTKVTRNGYKRIPGLSEPAVEDNQVLPVILTSVTTNLGPKISGRATFPVLSLGDAEFENIIIGRTATGDYDLARTQQVKSAIPRATVTTQNSRKA